LDLAPEVRAAKHLYTKGMVRNKSVSGYKIEKLNYHKIIVDFMVVDSMAAGWSGNEL